MNIAIFFTDSTEVVDGTTMCGVTDSMTSYRARRTLKLIKKYIWEGFLYARHFGSSFYFTSLGDIEQLVSDMVLGCTIETTFYFL